MVPVQRVRTEKRTRKVPVHRQRSATVTRRFPPAGAKFAFASGEEITIEQIEELAAEPITIVRLSHGETLTDQYRQILKPDTIIMTLAAPEKEESSDEEESDDEEESGEEVEE